MARRAGCEISVGVEVGCCCVGRVSVVGVCVEMGGDCGVGWVWAWSWVWESALGSSSGVGAGSEVGVVR